MNNLSYPINIHIAINGIYRLEDVYIMINNYSELQQFCINNNLTQSNVNKNILLCKDTRVCKFIVRSELNE